MTSTTAACGHTTETESQLCPTCTTHLAERLGRMERCYDALTGFLAPGSRRPELGHATATEAPLPVRTAVLDLRGPGGIVSVLEDWRAAIHAERGFTVPVPTGSVRQRIGIAAQAIHNHLSWIALTWEMGAVLAREIRMLEQRVRNVIDPPDATIPIGQCPADMGEGEVCGAQIRVPAGTQDVRCRKCGTNYPPSAWLNLRKWMNTDADIRGHVA